MTTPPAIVGTGALRESPGKCTLRHVPASFAPTLCRILTGLIAMGAGSAAVANDYPTRPITMVVPFAAGGPTDMVARIVVDHMSTTLGRQIVVENAVGAGGTAATARVMRAPADGYTIELGNMGTHAAAVALYPRLGYNPTTDFEPIGLSVGMPVAIFARKDLPVRNLQEFAVYAKANADRLSMAHAGIGSVSFTTCLSLNAVLEVKPMPVAYNSARPAMTALASGQIDYMCDQVANGVVGFARGTVKALAVASATRSPALPGVPTTREAGLPAFEVTAWNALFAPKGTPQPILDRLTGALDKALSDEATRKRLIELGCDIPDSPQRGQKALASLVESEVKRWTTLIEAVARRQHSESMPSAEKSKIEPSRSAAK